MKRTIMQYGDWKRVEEMRQGQEAGRERERC